MYHKDTASHINLKLVTKEYSSDEHFLKNNLDLIIDPMPLGLIPVLTGFRHESQAHFYHYYLCNFGQGLNQQISHNAFTYKTSCLLTELL